MGNLNNSGNLGFSSLLYVNFIIKKKYRVDEVAKEMQIATDTLYRYVRGENIIPPDRIIDLIKATHDLDYLEFFSDPVGYLVIQKIKDKIDKKESILESELKACLLNAKAIEIVEKALEDGIITDQEFSKIHSGINKARQALASLEALLNKSVKK